MRPASRQGVWPHAVLSGHAHSYQRYTRSINGIEIPHVIEGNGGHGLTPLTKKGEPGIRVPVALTSVAGVTFENYDAQDYGYLRIIVNAQQLRIKSPGLGRNRRENAGRFRYGRFGIAQAGTLPGGESLDLDGPATSIPCIER